MVKVARHIVATALICLPATVSAVPQVAVSNDRTYRATGDQTFRYNGGELTFVLFDGDALSNVECPSLPAGVGLLPFPPGVIPCPAGHNAFVSTRFGDRDRDVSNTWQRLGSVNEASRIPARLPELMRLIAAPLTDLPRPSADFRDRSTIVLHDLQSATFSERDTSRYEMPREYLVPDLDFNGDGVITAFERQLVSDISGQEELRHLRETIIMTGNANGYLFDYPIRPFIELNKDVDPALAPRDQIAVNQLQFVEAYPGISNRADITNTKSGFFFKDLANFGTDFDGDPALLVDFRLPGSLAWEGNDFSNLIGGLDNAFLRIFERRYNAQGTPQSFEGPGGIGIESISLGEEPGVDPVVLNAPFRVEETEETFFFLVLLQFEFLEAGHGLESGEEINLFETGFSILDGQRFFVSQQSDQAGFDGNVDIELFLDPGLTVPFVLDALPDGTLGVMRPIAAGATDIQDITVSVGAPASVNSFEPHGLTTGDIVTFVGTGFSALDGNEFFVEVIGDADVNLFTDAGFQNPLDFQIPATTGLSAVTGITDDGILTTDIQPGGLFGNIEFIGPVIVGAEQNDFEFPIYPFPFIEDNFGSNGQLILPSVFDQGYEIPDFTFRFFFGTPNGAQNLGALPEPPRNDLIMRLRFSRNVLGDTGDISTRDFEVELCLVDTLEGVAKVLSEASGKSAQDSKGAKSEVDPYAPDADLDGDGQSNLYEFAFDVNGSPTEISPALSESGTQVSAQVAATIDPETSLCELSLGKRPGVREYLEYYFEEVGADGVGVEIDPTQPDSDWELVADDNFSYKLVSKDPVSGSSFFRACVRKNTFGIEITE